MPKAKKMSARRRRLADKLKKREKREKHNQDSQDCTRASEPESVVPCGTADGAELAPPGNFPGQGSMGLPPFEEKPLARVQASPRVKMHSPAPRLPSPRGSRLFVRNEDKAPSPDSPAWVCAPPRAPGSGIVHMSGPAGQAQLDTSREEETSRISKDEEFLTDIKKESERNTHGILNKECDISETIDKERDEIEVDENLTELSDNEAVENILKRRHETCVNQNKSKTYGGEVVGNVVVERCDEGKNREKLKVYSVERESTTSSLLDRNVEENTFEMAQPTSYSVSVQGSFHQGDPLFGENAGTQCVANCLAGLAYGILKSPIIWQTSDMNKILVTGDELYTYLQQSSEITSRYLLVDELPQYFESYSKTFEFKVKLAVSSLISLSDEEPCYEDFNAFPLFEALQMVLVGTNGCFVCFGGNTLLVGRTSKGFYIFDSHSRCCQGYISVNGKSTRILVKSVYDVYLHLVSLALSMGFSRIVECELTGVMCSLKQFDFAPLKEDEDMQSHSDTDVLGSAPGNALSESRERLYESEVIFLSEESKKHKFIPLSIKKQEELCRKLGLSFSLTGRDCYAESLMDMGAPTQFKDIAKDGNCFFRAISFCLTNSEDHHQSIRNAVCQHLLQYETWFQKFMRCEAESVRAYLLRSKMSQEGIWATELEIFAVSDMLNVDIFTYSDMKWLQFNGNKQDVGSEKQKEGIYLYHNQQNHYDVVLDVSARLSDKQYQPQSMSKSYLREYDLRRGNRIRMRKKRGNSNVKMVSNSKENRKSALRRKKYHENEVFRREMLENKKKMYSCAGFKMKIQTRNRNRYHEDEGYKSKLRRQSVCKYATNLIHKQDVKKRSVLKYWIDAEHRESVKKRSCEKYSTNREHKQNVKNASTEKYRMDLKHKQDAKRRSTEKYKTDERYRKKNKAANVHRYRTNVKFKEKQQENAARRYKTDSTVQAAMKNRSKISYQSSLQVKENKKKRMKKQRKLKQVNLQDEEVVVKTFKENAGKGPEYACCCCHRLLFRNQVQGCEHQMYEQSEASRMISDICLQKKYMHECFEFCRETCSRSSQWICFTCHRKILSGKAPSEAAANNLSLEDIPPELNNLNSLEQHLIALHIPFMKIMALPHGGQRNIHGPIVCVPSDVTKATHLPLQQDKNLLLRVKLKRKLNYKGYFEYQFVNTSSVMTALAYLKEKNQWYKDVKIETTWEENDNQEENIEDNTETITDREENEEQMIAFDTCLQPVDVAQEVLDHYFDDVYNIAPGEGRNPVRMLQEPGNEAKSFPCHFPTGRFSWNEERSEKLTLSRYFNNRLMNADNRFARDTSYIFFSQYMSELNQVIEKTQISLRKSLSKIASGKSVTANMLQDPGVLSSLLRNDDAIRFMQPIRGTPAYWAAAQKDLFAMLRQIGIPTWFCSFSAAEYRWNDAVRVILHHLNDDRNPEEMDWSEKNEVLRCNPVTVARMFEHRFHTFHREVILSPAEPIGKVVDYFQRVEFQQRGSPHMHCLYWVENAPNIDSDGEETVCNFIDRYVTCALPSEMDDFDLRKTVLEVQQHSKKHSKTCKKKGTECRFNFPRPPSQRTFISTPQDDENLEHCETEAVERKINKAYAKEILLSVWDKVQTDGEENSSIEEIFNDLSLTQELYEEAQNTLLTRRTVILQRTPNEMWTNQYNRCLLKCWDANMDIQFVLDPFSCIVYIVSYISKAEREMGMLLKQTKLEAEEGNFDARQTMKKIGSAYLHHREVSAQEAVYRVCNLKMKECSRKVAFIPVGDNPVRLSKPLSQLKKNAKKSNGIIDEGKNDDDDDDDDDDEIWMTNVIERYENRPDKSEFQGMCLAEFCAEFRVLSKSQVPKNENKNVFELQNEKGYVQRRTRTKPAIIRYPRFNAEKTPEKYYQSLLQLFLPYWTEIQLKPPGFALFKDFYETGHVKIAGKRPLQSVKSIVDSNHLCFAKNEDVIDRAQEAYETNGDPEDAWSSLCPETEVLRGEGLANKKENQVPQEDGIDSIPEMESDTHNADVLYQVQQIVTPRDEIVSVLQNLNEMQHKIFYFVRNWCSAKVAGEKCEPLHLFVTGGAGTGKSHLIKAIHYEASRLLSKLMSEPERMSVLLSAFTGTAAFNIGGNTLHHLFSLTKYLPLPYEPLREQSLSEMRAKIGDLQILIIDEISMVYKRLLYYIHERLVQIKKCKEPFGGVSVIAVGDFYQLPPVKQRKDERLYKENMVYPLDYWLDLFQIAELNEIMRQKEDLSFAEILNSLRVRQADEPLTQEQNNMLDDCIRDGPEDALHVFSTNEEVNTYNLLMLRKSCDNLFEIKAEDYQKDKTSGKLTLKTNPITKSKSDGLPSSLILSVNARVMLTRNCNVEDGLVNGVMGYISQFVFRKGSATDIKAIGVIFDNKEVGKKRGRKTDGGNMVLIERVEEEMKEKTKTVIRHQFPLRLSWACTAHKVQGMTTDRVVVNVDRVFGAGQAYVALSRVTSKDGLFIETENPHLLSKKIYADSEVKTATFEMPKVCFHDIDETDVSGGKKIILHNIQSLGKHFQDLKNDKRFTRADIICLTETWLRHEQNTRNLELQGFQFHHLPREKAYVGKSVKIQRLHLSKGGGVGLYLKDQMDCYKILSLSEMNIEAMAVQLLNENIVLLTVYRPSMVDIDTFLTNLLRVLDFLWTISPDCIVIGDFNEDAKSNGPIQKFMKDKHFRQLVTFKTTEGGTILDHVYVSSEIYIEVFQMPTYYSYHEAVLMKFYEG
ncbi:uncharacterized protein LOC133178496 [Saccostrea echinata]|uniref:uncharacterized protein LOC133178496 n=1 Tax=Saccostrea echinata TaxID=191078 RepID=UPI002A824ACC|nr:uncharacterized protein LOC133178496 [Saccostrea echinata]